MFVIIEGVVKSAKAQTDFETKVLTGSVVVVQDAVSFEPITVRDCPVGFEQKTQPGDHFMAVCEISTPRDARDIYVRFAEVYDPEAVKYSLEAFAIMQKRKQALAAKK